MIRAYGLLGVAALLVNGSTLAPVIAFYHATIAQSRAASAPSPVATPIAFAVEAEKGRDGLFRVTGIANRHPVHFIVDTGATVTVLSARDAAKLGLSPGRAEGSGTLRTVGGSAAMTWKSLDSLTVAGSHLSGIDVVVVRGGPDHSLLGQDVLSQLGTVTMASGRLEIRPPAG